MQDLHQNMQHLSKYAPEYAEYTKTTHAGKNYKTKCKNYAIIDFWQCRNCTELLEIAITCSHMIHIRKH